MPPEGQRHERSYCYGDLDILLMTETWLCASGGEAYVTEMTPNGYHFRSCPRIDRSGGIAIVFTSPLSDSISIQPLSFNSCESVELRLSRDDTSASAIC